MVDPKGHLLRRERLVAAGLPAMSRFAWSRKLYEEIHDAYRKLFCL
jgi:hypothetical protein